jgi:hypothetical protein
MKTMKTIKNLLSIIFIIILIILILLFILFLILKKESDIYISKANDLFRIIEGFENATDDDDDVHGVFFDLSSNYFTLSDFEKSQTVPPPEEEQILDIGSSFGDIDPSRIPWDSENRSLAPQDTLWGVVPSKASASFFAKLTSARQLSNPETLQVDESGKNVSYQSPDFTYNPEEEAQENMDLEIAIQVAAVAAPMLGEALMELKETIEILKKVGNALEKAGKFVGRNLFKVLDFVSGGLLSGIIGAGSKLGNKLGRIAQSIGNRIGKSAKPAMSVIQKSAAKAITAATSVSKNVGKGTFKILKNVNKIPGLGKFAKLTGKLTGKIGKLIGKILSILLRTVIVKSAFVLVGFAALDICPGPCGGGIGATLDIMYMAIVMPIVMVLTLPFTVDDEGQPQSFADKMITKAGDPEGCCPDGFVSVNKSIPEWVNTIFLANIPILGDIFDMVFPYMCVTNYAGVSDLHHAPKMQFVLKQTLILPKYLKYEWLSSYYLDWPEYNCRDGSSPVNGKKKNGSTYVWNSGNPYIYFQQIINSPSSYAQNGTYIIAPGAGQNFMYADFTEPQMLVNMAQFYYDWAIKNPYPNDDGTVTVEYINKINYVIASSLYSCDVMCEITSVTYDMLTGSNYSEEITYDRDRRFYYFANNVPTPPIFWEKNDSTWRAKDDAYDLAIDTLNSYINQGSFNNKKISAEILLTGYTQIIDATNRYIFMSNITMTNRINGSNTITTSNISTMASARVMIGNINTSNKGIALSNDTVKKTVIALSNLNAQYQSDYNIVLDFKDKMDIKKYNFDTLCRTNLAGLTDTHKTTINGYLSNIFALSNDLWNYHKSLPSSQIGTYVNNQYKIAGCTHVDDTAAAAAEPSILDLDEETRYRVDFNVMPYLKRCEGANMNIIKCIDPSNIDMVVYSYLEQNPTKRIKSINSVKALGKNACQYIWDEVTYNPVTRTETNMLKNVVSKILYQQDLSSCTFCLPTSNILYGSGGNYSTDICPPLGVVDPNSSMTFQSLLSNPPESVKMYKNPTDTISPNNSLNTRLQYLEASVKIPVFAQGKDLPVRFDNALCNCVPRYDPNGLKTLLPLSRPKKPIYIQYPKDDEANLGNQSNNFCFNPLTMKNILLNYNGNSNNVNKIVKIIRAYTVSSNICDLEVDMFIQNSNVVQRTTLSVNVRNTEGFQNTPYTYSSTNNMNGLNIDPVTSVKDPTASDLLNTDMTYNDGYGYAAPYLKGFKTNIISNSSFFNDDLIKSFTDKTKELRNNTQKILTRMTGTIHLGDSNCVNTTCRDPEVLQRIIEQYNKDGYPKRRLSDLENDDIINKNSIIQIVNSATNSSNTCHLIFENKNETYGDFYGPKSSSNYTTENRLFLKKVQMKNDPGTCTFYPVPNQRYIDISASDIALGSASNFNSYVTPVRNNCIPVNCRDPNLYNAAFNNYKNITGNTVNNIQLSMNIGNNICDYLINTDLDDGEIPDNDFILRVTYDNTLFTRDMGDNCTENNTYRYINGNFSLQTPDDISEYYNSNVLKYIETVDENSSNISPLTDFDPTNISDPLYLKVNKTLVNFS